MHKQWIYTRPSFVGGVGPENEASLEYSISHVNATRAPGGNVSKYSKYLGGWHIRRRYSSCD